MLLQRVRGDKMLKLLKLLGVLAVVTSSTGHASASSITENFIFSYSTNGSFKLSNLSYSSTSNPSVNLLTSLSPFTSSAGGTLSGSGKLSETISVSSTQSYTSNYSITGSSATSSTFGVSVSPVPLPASFPLFAMAIIGLGVIGYYKVRPNSRMVAA